jgi:inhibitor of KinA
MREYVISPLSEQAVIISLTDETLEDTQRFIHLLIQFIEKDHFPGYIECVPGMQSLCIYYDLTRVSEWNNDRFPMVNSSSYDIVTRWLTVRLDDLLHHSTEEQRSVRPVVQIPVCYCSLCGPDAEAVSHLRAMTKHELVSIHVAGAYTVAMIGFLPGFPYLDGLDERLVVPRRNTPRKQVAAGSVAIAESQSGIYPTQSPGGWNIIGRTSTILFDEFRSPPSLLQIGDHVKFIEVPHDEQGKVN